MTRVDLSLASMAPGTMGGSERYAAELLRALAALAPDDVALRLLLPAGAERWPDGDGVRLDHVSTGRAVPGGGPPRLAALLAGLALGTRRGRALAPAPDLTHHLFTVPVLRTSPRAVVTLHDVAHHDAPAQFGAAERAFRRVAYDLPARRALAVTTPSAHARDRACDVLGLDPARVVVVPHGVDLERFRPATADEPRPPALPERYLLFPANLWPHKNHERLVRALVDVDDRELSLVLTGAADPARLQAIVAAASSAGVAARVRHLGRVPDRELAALYRHAAAVIVPSLYEGYGLPALEALASGTPVAVADRGALPEVAGEAAVRFNPEDVAAITAAIDEVTRTGPRADARRSAGLALAARRTWAAAARAHIDLYRRLG